MHSLCVSVCILRAVLVSQQNWEAVREISHITPGTCMCIVVPIINDTQQKGTFYFSFHLRFNLHWHIIITPSPSSALEFILGVVHFMGLNKYVLTCIHHYNIIQSIFYCLPNQLCSAYWSLSLSNPWKSLIFYYLHSFVYSRMLCIWNNIVCRLFRLTSFV